MQLFSGLGRTDATSGTRINTHQQQEQLMTRSWTPDRQAVVQKTILLQIAFKKKAGEDRNLSKQPHLQISDPWDIYLTLRVLISTQDIRVTLPIH